MLGLGVFANGVVKCFLTKYSLLMRKNFLSSFARALYGILDII